MSSIKSPEKQGLFTFSWHKCCMKKSQKVLAVRMRLLSVCVGVYTYSLRSVMKEEHSFSAYYDMWIWATKTHSCTCVSQAHLLGWIVLKTQDSKVPLGQKADWVITREQAGENRSSLEVMLWNCYPSDICLWEEWRTQWRDSVFGIHAFLKLLLALSLLYQVSL